MTNQYPSKEVLQATEEDLAALLRSKVNQVTNLELKMETLVRILSERDAEIVILNNAELRAAVEGEADA